MLLLPMSSSWAASVRRIDGGRIEILAFDQRLVFREKDAPSIEMQATYETRCDSERIVATVDRWLNEPKVGECLDKAIPDHAVLAGPGHPNQVDFEITLSVEDGLVYPGGIDRNLLTQSTLDLRKLWVTLGYNEAVFQPAADEKGDWKPAAFGYEQLEATPTDEYFRLSADARLRPASRRLSAECHIGAADDCFVYLRSPRSTTSASVHLFWRTDSYASTLEKLQGPTPDWVKYDVAARAMADAIFIDRTQGELQ